MPADRHHIVAAPDFVARLEQLQTAWEGGDERAGRILTQAARLVRELGDGTENGHHPLTDKSEVVQMLLVGTIAPPSRMAGRGWDVTICDRLSSALDDHAMWSVSGWLGRQAGRVRPTLRTPSGGSSEPCDWQPVRDWMR